MKNLQELPQFEEGLSWVYLDCCRVEQDAQSVAVWTDEGVAPLPAASLAVLLLGPGSTITHSAVKTLTDNGCSIVWVGQDGVRTYAGALGETRHSRNLLRQAWLATREEPRLAVVTKMYALRFEEQLEPGLTLGQIRGKEGARVRDAYAEAARQHGVEWAGRNYERGNWDHADPLNRALSAANACLYGLCHAACLSLGYSPALGFIHTGKQLSFVYDLGDFYKTEVSVPVAFKAVAEGHDNLESQVRRAMREQMHEKRLLRRLTRDIPWVMDVPFRMIGEDQFAADPAMPNLLWEPSTGLETPLPFILPH